MARIKIDSISANNSDASVARSGSLITERTSSPSDLKASALASIGGCSAVLFHPVMLKAMVTKTKAFIQARIDPLMGILFIPVIFHIRNLQDWIMIADERLS